MNAIIINIGDELLIGQVTNFNASWMAEQLNLIGVDVVRINVISDKEQEILNALKDAEIHADLVLITGGLGPTNDDITALALCKYFNTHMVFDQTTFEDIVEMFKHRGFTVTNTNRKQAEVPAGCRIIRNLNGTAPGLWFEKNGKIFVATPGVPFEMRAMMSNLILPSIEQHLTGDTIVHKTILTQGVGESFLADIIADWENKLPENIRLAYLPSPGYVRLRLTARGPEKDLLNEAIASEVNKLQNLIAEYIYGYDSETMEQVVGKLLTSLGKTVVTAESCTGGYIAHLITKVPGSSGYFRGSVIAYSNEIKESILGVQHETLMNHGAVSEETVKEMAVNVRIKLNADYSIAASGIAGPDGGTDDKPVGTIWIAIASATNCTARKFQFGNLRQVNIERATITALNMLRKEVLGER